ncbi:hypothetical protein BS17DRAFT_771939 [Gyrodon lividus]|nr:hypothetical protein BS17DRAFT_771939 [Gyrodon lividus]
MITWIATNTGKVVGRPQGHVLFLYQFGSKYYVWNGIENVVCSIESPTNFQATTMRTS